MSERTATTHKAASSVAVLGAGGLLQRKCACGNSTIAGGECEGCSKKKLQRKLSIGVTYDPLELEADRVGDQVLAVPRHSSIGGTAQFIQRGLPQVGRGCKADVTGHLASSALRRLASRDSALATRGLLQRQCACGNRWTGKEFDRPGRFSGKLQRKRFDHGSTDAVPSVVNEVLCSPGMPLNSAVRAFMETRFDRNYGNVRLRVAPTSQSKLAVNEPGDPYEREADRVASDVLQSSEHSLGHEEGGAFANVRVHADAKAAEAAHAVNARAFTVGNSIVFGAGEYQLSSSTGLRLLAHELTHVVHQGAAGENAGLMRAAPRVIQRQEPVTTAAAGVTIGAIAGKCIVGAITGALFDAALQAIIHSIREWTWRFWRTTWDYCSLILSAILGCIAAPVAAFAVEPWVAAELGPRLAAIEGTLIGKILLFIAKKLAIGIPKFIVKHLAMLGCISPEQAAELDVKPNTPADPVPPAPTHPGPAPAAPEVETCRPMSGDIVGSERILMKVNTAQFLTRNEEVKFDKFSDSLRGTGDKVKIHGLASVDGPAELNDKLSCTRATTAAKLLQDRGISAGQISGLFKHGEVPGPHDWQRSVVLEREAGTAPPSPLPGPTPVPPTPTPTPAMTTPRVGLKSINFRSEHGVLKDNRDNWSSSGKVFPKPHWRASNPGAKSAPISHDKAKNIQVELTVDVSPASASGVPFTLRGQGPYGFLDFETSGSLNGGTDIILTASSDEPTPNAIGRYLNQVIAWSLTVPGGTQLLAVTLDHDVFVTLAAPLEPDEVTYRRMDKAVQVTQNMPLEPHQIVRGIMANWNRYNLQVPLSPTGWEWIDNFENGAQCIDIARFVHGVINMIGSPGTAETVVVYAEPASPQRPVEQLWETAGCSDSLPAGGWSASRGACALHKYPAIALLDGDWKSNAFEAALKFEHGGKLAYYPGGVKRVASSALEVLHAFRCLARVSAMNSTQCRIEQVYADYPAGPCPPGAIKVCWYK